MSRTLSQMRGDVRVLIDDQDSERFSDDTVVNLAINRAAVAVSRTLYNYGWTELVQTQLVALNAGLATITPAEKIRAVYFTQDDGATLFPIAPGGGVSRMSNKQISGKLLVEYIAATDAIDTDGYTISYNGIDVDDLMVDQLCAYMAAQDLKTTEGEVNPAITAQIQNLENRLKQIRGIQISAEPIKDINNLHSFYKDCRWFKSGSTTLKVY